DHAAQHAPGRERLLRHWLRLLTLRPLEPHHARPSSVAELAWVRLGLEDREQSEDERDTAIAHSLGEDRTDVARLPPELLEEGDTVGRGELQRRVVEMRAHALLQETEDRRRCDIEDPPADGRLSEEVPAKRADDVIVQVAEEPFGQDERLLCSARGACKERGASDGIGKVDAL